MSVTEAEVPPARQPAPEDGRDISQESGISEEQGEAIDTELQRLLPAALLEASQEAHEAAAAVSRSSVETALTPAIATLAAALGSAAAPLVASALKGRLARRALGHAHCPTWLQPAIVPGRAPVLVTMTEFSQRRSNLVHKAEKGVPVLLSRHGTVVAAIIPLEPGAYERAVYPDALRRVDEDAAERRAQLLKDWETESQGTEEPTSDWEQRSDKVDQKDVSSPMSERLRREQNPEAKVPSDQGVDHASDQGNARECAKP